MSKISFLAFWSTSGCGKAINFDLLCDAWALMVSNAGVYKSLFTSAIGETKTSRLVAAVGS